MKCRYNFQKRNFQELEQKTDHQHPCELIAMVDDP